MFTEVDVRLEHLSDEHARVVDVGAVRKTAERFVADSAAVSVIITGDYRATLRGYSHRYRTADLDQDAWMSGSAGVAIVNDDGGHTIVLRHQLWILDGQNPLQHVAHEALHVANRQRGEDMNGLTAQLSHPDDATKAFVGYAGMVIEEYRVDRAVLGDPTLKSAIRHDFDDDLRAFADVCRVGWERAQNSDDDALGGFSDIVQTAFIQMIYTAAGVCAADLASDGRIAPKRSEPAWSRLVGPHYAQIRAHLSRLPDASRPTEGHVLQTAALELAPLLIDWARYFGWTVTPGRAQGGFRTDWAL